MADSDVLIFGDTIRSPELRHEVPAPIGDPFIYAEHDGHRHVVVSQLDQGGVRTAAPDIEALAPESLGRDELLAAGMRSRRIWAELAVRACERIGVAGATVPPDFPVHIADRLRDAGVTLTVDYDLFTQRRRAKAPPELAGVRRAQAAADAGMAACAELLRDADVADGSLIHDGAPLTSERLKRAIEAAFSERDCVVDEIIVAPGAQGAEGHNYGSGAIPPGVPVIVDLWPQDRGSACFADMTRTFVAGDPPEEIVAWHALCREALERAVEQVRPGTATRDVWGAACDVFEAAGHPTQRTKAEGEVLAEGFFHGLGHGVGLEVHEAPMLGRSTETLVAGDVLAIEPGTYRPGFGGVRIEDLFLVTDDGAELLTDFPYELAP